MEAITARGGAARLRSRVGRAMVATSLALSVGLMGPLAGMASAAPANDAFPNARRISCDNFPNYRASNVGATAAPGGERLHGGDVGPVESIWYRWTPNRNRRVMFSTGGGPLDTTLAVYTTKQVPQPGSNVGLMAENDQWGDTPYSMVTFNARKGVTYHIAIDGYGSEEGATQLRC